MKGRYEKMENQIKTEFFVRLNLAMKSKEIKPAELSRLTGISKSALSFYINGKHKPTQTPLYLIAKALNVSEAWLMGYNVPMDRVENIKKVVTAEEKSVLEKFNSLTEENQKDVLLYIEFLYQKQV